MAIEINDATVGKQVQAYTHIDIDPDPLVVSASGLTLVPAKAGHRGVLVELGLYNSHTEPVAVTISDGDVIYRNKLPIPAGELAEVWLDDARNLTFVSAEDAAITITASVADKVQVTGGRYYYRAVSQ